MEDEYNKLLAEALHEIAYIRENVMHAPAREHELREAAAHYCYLLYHL